jgi:hypothetical protein
MARERCTWSYEECRSAPRPQDRQECTTSDRPRRLESALYATPPLGLPRSNDFPLVGHIPLVKVLNAVRSCPPPPAAFD